MVENNKTTGDGKASARTDAHDAMSRMKTETHAAQDAAREGRAALGDAMDSLSSRAKAEAGRRGEDAKDQAAEGLHSFADAIRSASDELATKQPGMVSDMIGHAAGGLESLSRTLQNRSAGQMIDDVRDFGRHNPASFMAVSVLAGIALGRFAGSSATHHHPQGQPAGYRAPQGPTGQASRATAAPSPSRPMANRGSMSSSGTSGVAGQGSGLGERK